MLQQRMHDMQDQMQKKLEKLEQMMYTASRIAIASAANDQRRGINQAFDEVSTTPLEAVASSSVLGRLYLPREIRAILSHPRAQCDETTCRRHRTNLLTIQYYFPSWFNQINAEIRIENQCSVHFSLRVPRFVGANDLVWIARATLDQVKKKLWSGELTVNDVDSCGMTVFHVSAVSQGIYHYLHVAGCSGRRIY